MYGFNPENLPIVHPEALKTIITDFKTRKQFKKYNKAPLLDNYHESILKRNTAKKVELTDTPEGVQ